jgi:hypothetical protein
MREPDVVPVLPRDPSAQSDSLPKYLVSAANITSNMPVHILNEQREQLYAQIIDFGLGLSGLSKYRHCQLTQTPAFKFGLQDYGPLTETPYFIRAPELTFYELSDGQVEKEWGLPSDVWSMACTVWSASLLKVD